MSKGNGGFVQRGGALPRGTLTLEEASLLPSLVGKNHMTVRRALEPARVGRWLPAGERHWRLLYDAVRVREISGRLAAQVEKPDLVCETYEQPVPSLSTTPEGPRAGWATSREIKGALYEHDIEAWRFSSRWLRDRLLTLGIASERHVVKNTKPHFFPRDVAIAALCADRAVQERQDPGLKRERLFSEACERDWQRSAERSRAARDLEQTAGPKSEKPK